MKSVLQDWVMNLPLKQQATLLSATRGPDNLEKNNSGKLLTRFVRMCVLVPANPNWKNNPNDNFFRIEKDVREILHDFLQNHDQYPHHFTMHLIHAMEIIGYKYPKDGERVHYFSYLANDFYHKMCDAFHMHGESEEDMDERLAI